MAKPKKLVVKEFEVTGDEEKLLAGSKYSHFYDPETGKYYRPVEGFTVTADADGDLSELFVEV